MNHADIEMDYRVDCCRCGAVTTDVDVATTEWFPLVADGDDMLCPDCYARLSVVRLLEGKLHTLDQVRKLATSFVAEGMDPGGAWSRAWAQCRLLLREALEAAERSEG